MKRTFLIIIFMMLLANQNIYASQAFEAAVPPGGDILSSDSSVFTKQYKGLSFKEISGFYETELKDSDNIKFRTFENENKIIIYDWGNRQWH